MGRRQFTREFKVEAARLVTEGGVSVAQAARNPDAHENVVRKWVKPLAADPSRAVPGHGQMKPEPLKIDFAYHHGDEATIKAERVTSSTAR